MRTIFVAILAFGSHVGVRFVLVDSFRHVLVHFLNSSLRRFILNDLMLSIEQCSLVKPTSLARIAAACALSQHVIRIGLALAHLCPHGAVLMLVRTRIIVVFVVVLISFLIVAVFFFIIVVFFFVGRGA